MGQVQISGILGFDLGSMGQAHFSGNYPWVLDLGSDPGVGSDLPSLLAVDFPD